MNSSRSLSVAALILSVLAIIAVVVTQRSNSSEIARLSSALAESERVVAAMESFVGRSTTAEFERLRKVDAAITDLLEKDGARLENVEARVSALGDHQLAQGKLVDLVVKKTYPAIK